MLLAFSLKLFFLAIAEGAHTLVARLHEFVDAKECWEFVRDVTVALSGLRGFRTIRAMIRRHQRGKARPRSSDGAAILGGCVDMALAFV